MLLGVTSLATHGTIWFPILALWPDPRVKDVWLEVSAFADADRL